MRIVATTLTVTALALLTAAGCTVSEDSVESSYDDEDEVTGSTSQAISIPWVQTAIKCDANVWMAETNPYVRAILSELCSGVDKLPFEQRTGWSMKAFNNQTQITVGSRTGSISSFYWGGGAPPSGGFYMPVIQIEAGPAWYIANAGSKQSRDSIINTYASKAPIYASQLTAAECSQVRGNSKWTNTLTKAFSKQNGVVHVSSVNIMPPIDATCSTLLKYDPWVLSLYQCGYFC